MSTLNGYSPVLLEYIFLFKNDLIDRGYDAVRKERDSIKRKVFDMFLQRNFDSRTLEEMIGFFDKIALEALEKTQKDITDYTTSINWERIFRGAANPSNTSLAKS